MPQGINRRRFVKAASAAGIAGIAGCIGSDSNNSQNQVDWASWSKPKSIADRISGEKYVPPEFNKDQVSNGIKYFNLGSMKHDPATKWFQDRFKKRTEINVSPIVVPSKQASGKITTVLSSQSKSPVIMQVDRQMYLDFVEPGWLEPVDDLWNNKAYEYFPRAFKEEFVTDIDASRDGEHIYMSVAIAEGSLQNYRPDLLQELGFEADFLKRPTWSDIREVCEEAKSQSKDYHGYVWYGGGVRYPSYPWMLRVWSQGENIVKDDGTVVVNSEAGVNALEEQVNLIEENLVPDVLQYGQGGPEDLFLSDRVVSYVGGSKMIPMALEELGAPGEAYDLGLPAKADNNGEHTTFIGTDCLCINRYAPAKKKRAAKVYLDGARSAEAEAQEFIQEGNMPTNSAAWDIVEQEQEEITHFKDIVQESIQNAREGMWPRQIQTIEEAIVPNLQKAWGGNTKPKAALNNAQEMIDGVLDQ
ncbi:extracellular solute-binding protein [Halomicrococcus sp. NG-SE-24]|uniref:extracellular solute-binding protein n=1 Tax=Halomicrococcus sp. NG-SE-24 TaxID=3436928 RepID=UPI003D9838D8